MAALIVAILAILVSVTAVIYTRSSAQSASNAVALTLSTDVEVRLLNDPNLSHNRWVYNDQVFKMIEDGWHPRGADPGTEFATPGSDSVIIGVAAAVEVKNVGNRIAEISLSGDFVIAHGIRISSPQESLNTDRVVPTKKISLDAGKSQSFTLFQGISVRQWFDSGKIDAPINFRFPISATAGVDSVTQHWDLTIVAAIFESSVDNKSGARVVASSAPKRELTEIQRTYPTRAFGLRHRTKSSR
jgi:hypothetical protein